LIDFLRNLVHKTEDHDLQRGALLWITGLIVVVFGFVVVHGIGHFLSVEIVKGILALLVLVALGSLVFLFVGWFVLCVLLDLE
jgi:hypothetical protein